MNVKHILIYASIVLFAAGCSTTRRLGEGETLYTGVKKMEIESLTGENVQGAVESAVKSQLSVKPNNPLLSPWVRTPLPVGLWTYNAFYTERQTGLRAWLFRNFAKAPVLISDVQPDLRMNVVRDILDNHGYFGSTASCEIVPVRKGKTARISYRVGIPAAWHYSSVEFPAVQGPVTQAIDSLRRWSLIQTGDRYDIDSLTNERVRITNALRNNSYYYFRPEYIEYLADTTRQHLGVDLRMEMAQGIPEAALQPYRIGNIIIQIYNTEDDGTAAMMFETLPNGMMIYYQEPLKIRPKIFQRTITIQSGRPARVRDINTTLTNLTKMGIFRYVNMTVTPLDLIKPGAETLDMTISMAMDKPMNAELEFDMSQKSSNFVGPKAAFSVRHKNFIGGGEIFSVKVNGGYEWQTGHKTGGKGSRINSYEVGLSSSLTFPRLVAPGFIRRSNRFETHTTYQLGADLLNRPSYFKMLSASGSIAYRFQSSRRSFHDFTLFKLTYNRLLSTTDVFDELLSQRRALRQSFDDQFIPLMSYTYTYDRRMGSGRRDRFVWQMSPTSSGNLFSGIYSLFGVKGEKKLFGLRFSQFVKLTNEVKYFKQVGRSTLAMRLFAGAAYAYGNSGYLELPFSEQFAIGGANSIRAYTIRTVGPGSFRSDKEYGNLDQTGDFKLETNIELRIPVVAGLQTAVFLDAGNIWMLGSDPDRPGSRLKAKTFLNDVATGTGVGLRYDLGFLVIRGDFGVGLHLPYPTGRRGYFNAFWTKQARTFHLAIGYPF